MISLILGIGFSFEAAGIFISIIFALKNIIFNDTHPILLFILIFYALICFFVGQLFFYLARKKYDVESIMEIPILNINVKEDKKLEHIIEGRDIAEIKDGKITFIEKDENEEEKRSTFVLLFYFSILHIIILF